MFGLTAKIYIGKYEFNHVHEMVIKHDRKKITGTAVIKMPQKYDKYLPEVINAGDQVEIWLGYDGNLIKEFSGYVSNVKPNIPVEIICEDTMYQLKRKKPTSQAYSGTLKGLIESLAPGIKCEVPVINLSGFKIEGKGSIAYALQKIKDAFHIDIYYRDDVLFAGLPFTDPKVVNTDPVLYDLDKNVIRPSLNYRSLGDVKLRIKAISMLPNNTKIQAEVGDPGGSLKTQHFYGIETEAELKVLANSKLSELKYEGFEGSITTFGIPYIEHGHIAKIEDSRFNNRSGSYFVDRIVVRFGINGFRRDVFLGRRAS